MVAMVNKLGYPGHFAAGCDQSVALNDSCAIVFELWPILHLWLVHTLSLVNRHSAVK